MPPTPAMHPAPDLQGPRLALVVATATYTDPGFAGLREAWSLPAGSGEIPIAQAATAAFAQNKLLSVLREVDAEFCVLFQLGGFAGSGARWPVAD